MSTMTETLANVNKILDEIDPKGPTVKAMTKEQFIAYAKSEVEKASKEDEEKAKKRLDVLKAVIETLRKAAWEGTNEQMIPIYEEPNLTAKTDESDSSVATPPGPGGTGADGASFAAAGGAQSFAKQLDSLAEALTKTAEPAKKSDIVWPQDVNEPEFLKEGIAKRGADWGTDPA